MTIVKVLVPREVLLISVLLTLGRVNSLVVPDVPIELLHRTTIRLVTPVLIPVTRLWTNPRIVRVRVGAVDPLALTVYIGLQVTIVFLNVVVFRAPSIVLTRCV